jgi:hypothetical protein
METDQTTPTISNSNSNSNTTTSNMSTTSPTSPTSSIVESSPQMTAEERRIRIRMKIYDIDFMRDSDDENETPTTRDFQATPQNTPRISIQRQDVQQDPYEDDGPKMIVPLKIMTSSIPATYSIIGFNKKFPKCEGCIHFQAGQRAHMQEKGCLTDYSDSEEEVEEGAEEDEEADMDSEKETE